MFRISIIELGFTCALISLAIVIPLLFTRGYAKLNKRIKKIEYKVSKKR